MAVTAVKSIIGEGHQRLNGAALLGAVLSAEVVCRLSVPPHRRDIFVSKPVDPSGGIRVAHANTLPGARPLPWLRWGRNRTGRVLWRLI